MCWSRECQSDSLKTVQTVTVLTFGVLVFVQESIQHNHDMLQSSTFTISIAMRHKLWMPIVCLSVVCIPMRWIDDKPISGAFQAACAHPRDAGCQRAPWTWEREMVCGCMEFGVVRESALRAGSSSLRVRRSLSLLRGRASTVRVRVAPEVAGSAQSRGLVVVVVVTRPLHHRALSLPYRSPSPSARAPRACLAWSVCACRVKLCMQGARARTIVVYINAW